MKKKILALLILTTILTTGFVFAQGLQYEMTSYTSNSKDASTPFLNLAFFNKPYFTINYVSFSNAFQFIFDLMIGISIATAVILFVYGAFEGILTDTGSVTAKLDGKARMKNAIIGLMIVLSTWLIINTINPDLLRLPIFNNLDSLARQPGDGNSGDGNVEAEGF